MILKSVHLRNTCQHIEFRQEFEPGFTAITGPNFSGKSNLLSLIRASVTNNFNQDKSRMIYNLIEPKAVSCASTEWATDAGLIRVDRVLNTGCNESSGIYLDGMRLDVSRETDITDKFFELTGASPQIFNNFAFVAQREVDSFLKVTADQMVGMLSHLCGAEKMAPLQRMLGESIKAHRDRIDHSIVEDLDRANQVAEKAATKVFMCHEEYKKHKSKLLSKSERKTLREEVKRCKQRNYWMRRYESYRHLIVHHASSLKSARLNLDDRTNELINTQAALRAAEQETRRWADLSNQQQFVKRTRKRIAELEQTIAGVPPVEPVKPDVPDTKYSTSDDVSKAVAELRQHIKHLRILTDHLHAGDDKCAVCGTPVDRLPRTPEQYRLDIKDCQDRISLLEEIGEELAEYEVDHRSWEMRHAQYKSDFDRATAELKELRKLKLPEQDYDEAKHKEALVVESGLRHAELELSGKIGKWKNRLRTGNEDIQAAKLGCQRAKAFGRVYEGASVNKLQALRNQLAEDKQQRKKLLRAKHDFEIATMEFAQAEKEAQRISKLRDKDRITQALVDFETRAREYLAPSKLPKMLVGMTAKRLQGRIHTFLDAMQAGFSVEIGDDATFVAKKADGTTELPRRLSGAQSSMLGLAFWLSRLYAFGGNVRSLFLDEPIDGLDEAHQELVATMLRKLSSVSDRRFQVILVTHNRTIAEACENVISFYT